MDVRNSDIIAMNITKDNGSVVCFNEILITSSGVWFGDNPLSFDLPLLLAQMSLIITVASVFHSVLRRLGQPKAVSHIMGGAILGASVAGRSKDYARIMFPMRSWIPLNLVGQIGLLLFLFTIGVKTDLGMIRKSGRKALAIGISCNFLPFVLMILAAYLLRHSLPPGFMANNFLIQLSATWGRTSFAVVSCLLDELNLLNSKVGRLAIAATLIGDVIGTMLHALFTAALFIQKATNQMMGIGSVLSFLGLLAFILFVARPLTLWIGRKTPEGEQMDEAYFLVVIIMAFTCGLAGELIGQHAPTAAFLLGLALPGGHPLGTTLQVRFDAVVSGMFVPLFMAGAGYRSNFFSIADQTRCGYLLLLLVLGTVGKLVGVMLPCLYCKVPLRDAVVLMLMMISKGIFEVFNVDRWQDTNAIDAQLYAFLVLCTVATTAISAPILKAIYKPSTSYIAYKRRTIQHAKRDAELRLLACVHNQENVAPIVDFLNAAHATTQSPICVYVLHLVQLVGHAAAMLGPYDKHKGPSDHATETDHIVNAFRFFEQESRGSVLVQPFVAISPQATMHDDVCTLALDKKVSLVILPFHKLHAIDGTMEAMSAIKNMNVNTLNYAPCSVGIHIDHGTSGGAKFLPTKHLLHHIGVYFFGGPDDREALACATRMAKHPAIHVTLVRLRLPREQRESGPEEAMDDEVVREFLLRRVDDNTVMFREELVKDSEGTIGVIRATSDCFSLLIVGRRGGSESPLTEGLSTWSEFPELGVIGDVLASTAFGSNVSTLVVQQQARLGTDDADSIDCRPAGFRARFSRRRRRVSPLAAQCRL